MAAPLKSVLLIAKNANLLKNNIALSCFARHMTCRSKEFQSAHTSETLSEKDPFPIFSDKKVQDLLYRITGFDLLKAAGPQKKPIQAPSYKLLTDEELQKELHDARMKLKARLQMPPYMNPRKRNITPLSIDPDLANFDSSNYVFVDISFGVKDRKRNVLIRETDGTLRIAPWDVKERMNQIFNPREGRHYIKPKIFEEQRLEKLIVEKRFVYILDRACCQFEPDDPDFVRTTHRVYNAINNNQEYDILRSTRHFGSLAFYLAWNHIIDNLLLDMINRDLLSDAVDLINLHCIIHQSSPCSQAISQLESPDKVAIIQTYIKTEATIKPQLELSLQAFQDASKNKRKTN
ncbi:unnamed protein product [Lymnaea stagnalis]|uniref:Mitochondrial ribosomal protein S22 n=1 Tax=Lymnaea stagnalis TaxID=6523 RepID=A0AAV2IL97_LYMST